ncbi:hypothetical protein MBA34_03020 [Pseudomonas capeferrum]|uniref:hypothetical protein n=1 Tax=Pseudomonas capeferrum TaxID=1495066 RepID=UPI0004D92236|nr:hypothetical protein [Pseudomonas capeferrum]KEY85860.1 hypothetical protein PC358_19065 [Pseudomonas capeferrum]MCH7298013.1 hypothetical protein [Pseudomonas capeferrum]
MQHIVDDISEHGIFSTRLPLDIPQKACKQTKLSLMQQFVLLKLGSRDVLTGSLNFSLKVSLQNFVARD